MARHLFVLALICLFVVVQLTSAADKAAGKGKGKGHHLVKHGHKTHLGHKNHTIGALRHAHHNGTRHAHRNGTRSAHRHAKGHGKGHIRKPRDLGKNPKVTKLGRRNATRPIRRRCNEKGLFNRCKGKKLRKPKLPKKPHTAHKKPTA